MANTLTITYPVKGSKLFSARIDIVGDGSGEISATTLIDPATDLPGAPSKIKIRAIQWDLVGFDAELLWDATTDVHAFELPRGINGGIRFADTGAHLINNAGTGVTGKLLITTSGLTATGKGTILIEGQQAS